MSETFNQIVGRNALALRNERGLSTDACAKLLKKYGMSRSTLNRIELARNDDDPESPLLEDDKIKILAGFYGISLEAITESNPQVNKLFEEVNRELAANNKDESVYAKIIQLQKSLFLTDENGVLQRKDGSPRTRIQALMLMGKILYFREEYQVAARWYERALVLSLSAKDSEMVHKCRFNLASCYLGIGSCSEVIELVNQDMNDKTYESQYKQSFNHHVLGNAYIKLKNWGAAELAIRKAIELTPLHDFSWKARNYQLMASMHRKRKKFSQAIENLKESFTLAEDAKDSLNIAYVSIAYGQIYLDQEEIVIASEHFEKALSILSHLDRLKEKRIIEFLLAICFSNDVDEFEKAKSILDEIDSYALYKSYMAEYYKYLARLAVRLKLHKEANELYEKAFSVDE